MKVTLGYWGIKGRAQIARYLLAYTGTQFEDKLYTSQEEWFQKDKNNLGLIFPNLPYLIDGNFKLTESHAIYAYIINRSDKKDLLGKNLKDQTMIENFAMYWEEALQMLAKFCFNPGWEAVHKETKEKIQAILDSIKKIIGDKEWMFGYLTLADFYLQTMHPYVEKIAPEVLEKHQWLTRVRKGIENLPQVQKYFERQNSIKAQWISLPPSAAFKV